MYNNWFLFPTEAELALEAPLRRAVPERELLRSAVKRLTLKLSLDDNSCSALEAAGLGLDDLRIAFKRLATDVARTENPLRVIATSMAYVVEVAPELRTLLPNELLDQLVGVSLVRTLSDELFPLSGPAPDAYAKLRWAFSELVTFREVSAETLAVLTPDDRALLAERLQAKQALMLAVAPPNGGDSLGHVLATACRLLTAETPVDLATLNAAIAP